MNQRYVKDRYSLSLSLSLSLSSFIIIIIIIFFFFNLALGWTAQSIDETDIFLGFFGRRYGTTYSASDPGTHWVKAG